MSRYIDADEFLEDESEAYMRAQVNLAKEHADKTIDATRYVNEAVHKKIQMLIKEAPSADVVEVVRCKDCKYWRPDTRPEDSLEERADGLWGWGNLCVKHLPADECEAIEFGPEEFCNFGERKE